MPNPIRCSTHRLTVLWPLACLLLSAPACADLISPEPLTFSPGLSATDPASTSYLAGLEALRRGDLDAAEKAFTESSKANARMPQPLVGLADVAQRRDNPSGAKKLLEQAVSLAPDDASVHHALAAFHVRRQDFAAAEAELKIVIDLTATDLRPRLDLADLYLNSLSRPTDAIAIYRAAAGIDPQHAAVHHGLATALARTGQFEQAEAEFRKSAQLAPAAPLPLHSLAVMQLSRGQTEAGLLSLDAALKVQPTFTPALLEKGDVLLAQGKPDAALALFEQAVTVDAQNAAAQFKRGTALQMLKRTADAADAYRQAVSIDRDFAPAYNNLAWMAVESRTDLDQAAQWASTAVRLAPNNVAFRDTQGWVYRAQRRFAEAETVLEKAATMKPPLAEVKYHLGLVYLDQNKPDLAGRAFREALAIDANHAPSKQALQQLENAS